jgi:peptidoglycan-associated lipoprotein
MSSKNVRAITAMLLCLAVVSAGCAKKPPAIVTPPPAPTTPAPAPPPTPAPTPAPVETPPPAPISSQDFQPAFFDLDSYALRDDGRAALDKDAKLLRDHTSVQVTIEGHCDERGTVEYNQALGEKRAQAARDYLVGAGIAASRLNVISYGKERPFAPGHDEAAWQQNRRAHLVVRSSS